MKFKNWWYLVALALVMVFAASPALAGVGAFVTGIAGGAVDWVFDNALQALLTMAFAVVAAFFGATWWGKALLRAKAPITELKDVAVKVRAARRANSPGGKTITPEEMDGILKEVEDVVAAVITVFGAKAKTQ